jgi:hypothetical protein
VVGYDSGESGFTSSWRAVEDEGGEAVRVDGSAEEFAGGDDMRLSDDFVEGGGSHPFSERGIFAWFARRGRLGGEVEEVVHGALLFIRRRSSHARMRRVPPIGVTAPRGLMWVRQRR